MDKGWECNLRNQSDDERVIFKRNLSPFMARWSAPAADYIPDEIGSSSSSFLEFSDPPSCKANFEIFLEGVLCIASLKPMH